MTKQKLWAGIDAGEETARVCIIDESGDVVHEQECLANPDDVAAVLSAVEESDVTAAIESGTAIRLTRMLRARGFEVLSLEVRTVRRFLSVFSNKTDASDARGIAEIARVGRSIVRQVHVKTPGCQQIRSIIALRQKLVQQRLGIEGVLRSLFRLHADRPLSFRAPTRVRELIEDGLKQFSAEGIELDDEIRPLIAVWEHLCASLRTLDRKLTRLSRTITPCHRLQSIPGVGPLLSLSFYSAIEDPTRFSKAAKVGAYLGLAPRIFESGKQSRRLGISKRGNKITRSHLVMGAKSLLRKITRDSALKRWGIALVARTGHRKGVIAVARKLAVLMLSIWKNDGEYIAFPKGTAGPDLDLEFVA